MGVGTFYFGVGLGLDHSEVLDLPLLVGEANSREAILKLSWLIDCIFAILCHSIKGRSGVLSPAFINEVKIDII